VIELSRLLNELPIYPPERREVNFRNSASVSLKLGNLLSVDPQHQGAGLSHGGKLEQKVWAELADDLAHLHEVAEAIRHSYRAVEPPEVHVVEDDKELPERRILTYLYKLCERNPRLVRRKKEQVLARTGRLACKICNFDFASFYGSLEHGFIECHHLRPLAKLKAAQQTRLSDLALVCVNCHRVLHCSHPLLTMEKLKGIIAANCRTSL